MILAWKQLLLWLLPNGHFLILSFCLHLLISILLSGRAFISPLFIYLFSLFSVDSWFLVLFCSFIIHCSHLFWHTNWLRYGQLESLQFAPVSFWYVSIILWACLYFLAQQGIFYFSSWNEPFHQGSLFFFSGKWYLKTKIWYWVWSLLLGCHIF